MKFLIVIIMIVSMIGCADKTIQVGENIFVHNDRLYKVVDNELIKIADIDSKDSIKPQLQDFELHQFFKPSIFLLDKIAHEE